MKPEEAVDAIIDENDCDMFILSANISNISIDALITLIRRKENKKPNIALILTTYGGDPDAGYRLVKAIKRYYQKFILYVMGSCKSTGTLISLGADEIAMGDFGEFGPLDIQLTKDDEMLSLSGLSYTQSIQSLTEEIFKTFEHSFLAIKERSSGTITTKTAAEIGSKLAVGLLSPVSAQIDPIKLGEVLRAINIAKAYGSRIAPKNPELIKKLIEDYPSHGFVIDFEEAKDIFPNVRRLNENEQALENALFHIVRKETENRIVDEIEHSGDGVEPIPEVDLDNDNVVVPEEPNEPDQGNGGENGNEKNKENDENQP